MVPIFSPCFAAKTSSSGRRAMRPSSLQDLDQHAGRFQAGQRGEVAGRFGVAGAREHAARLRRQREDMARLHDVLRPASARTAVRIVCARS